MADFYYTKFVAKPAHEDFLSSERKEKLRKIIQQTFASRQGGFWRHRLDLHSEAVLELPRQRPHRCPEINIPGLFGVRLFCGRTRSGGLSAPDWRHQNIPKKGGRKASYPVAIRPL